MVEVGQVELFKGTEEGRWRNGPFDEEVSFTIRGNKITVTEGGSSKTFNKNEFQSPLDSKLAVAFTLSLCSAIQGILTNIESTQQMIGPIIVDAEIIAMTHRTIAAPVLAQNKPRGPKSIVIKIPPI